MVSASVCPRSRVTIRVRSRRWSLQGRDWDLPLPLICMAGCGRLSQLEANRSGGGPLTLGRWGRTQACPRPKNLESVAGERAAGGADRLPSGGLRKLLPWRGLAPWFSAVLSESPRGTPSGAAGKNSHENLGSRVGAQESPVHFQKRQSSGERRGEGEGEALIPAGPGKVPKGGGQRRGNFPGTDDSRMVLQVPLG